MTSWPVAMVDRLAQRGLFVIQLDTRDVGRSTWATTKPSSTFRQPVRWSRRDGYKSQSATAAAK
jgi:hypothetical protein